MDKPKFVGYWSAGAFVTPDRKDRVEVFEGTDSFSEDNGYDAEDKQGIEALAEGDTWYSRDYGRYHWIKRVE
jgi:hypothetical protein